MEEQTRGTLVGTEPHPASLEAMAWIRSMPHTDLMMWQESFASCAIEGNRLAEVCCETLSRLLSGDMVSDRYLLGLAWAMRYVDDTEVEVAEELRKQKNSGRSAEADRPSLTARA